MSALLGTTMGASLLKAAWFTGLQTVKVHDPPSGLAAVLVWTVLKTCRSAVLNPLPASLHCDPTFVNHQNRCWRDNNDNKNFNIIGLIEQCNLEVAGVSPHYMTCCDIRSQSELCDWDASMHGHQACMTAFTRPWLC